MIDRLHNRAFLIQLEQPRYFCENLVSSQRGTSLGRADRLSGGFRGSASQVFRRSAVIPVLAEPVSELKLP